MKFKFLAYLLLLVLSPLLAVLYGLLMLFGRNHEFKGSFPHTHRWYVLHLPLEKACCSDGSPYCIYLKKGTVNKLIVFFSGGGLAWDEYTAARPTNLLSAVLGGNTYYFPIVNPYLELINGGILSASDPRNPFNDWNCLFIPYATADCHVGNGTLTYHDKKGRERILYFNGARNVDAALEVARSVFGCPEQLIVAGESAGAIGCVAQADHVADYLGCARVAVYSDSGVIYTPKWRSILRDVWHARDDLVECVTGGNLLIDWFRRLHRILGDSAVYLMSSSSHDGTLSAYQSKINGGTFCYNARDLAEYNRHLTETVTTLDAELPTFSYLISQQGKNPRDGSTLHTAVRYPWYYSKVAGGLSLADWLDGAVNQGRQVNVGTEFLALDGEELAAQLEAVAADGANTGGSCT